MERKVKGANRLKKNVLWAIAILFVCVVVAGCKNPPPQQAEEETSISVQVASPKVGTMVNSIEVSGQIKALKWTTLSAKNFGRVSSVRYREGDKVPSGAVVVAQDTTDLAIQVKQAEAGLKSAKARLSQALTTAGVTDTQTEATIAQSKAALDAAKARLQLLKKGARDEEIKAAENAVASAEANYRNAEINLKRTRDLFAQGAQSRQQMDLVQMQYDVAKAQLDTARQQLAIVKAGAREEEIEAAQKQVDQAAEAYRIALAGRSNKALRQEDIKAARAAVAQAQSQLDAARQALSDCYTHTPLGGTVSVRSVEPGQTVGAGTPLMQIVDLDSIYYEATVSEMDIAQISPNQLVDLKVDALPGRKYTGYVSKILPVGDPKNRQFTIRIAIRNTNGELKPSMFVRGYIEIGRHNNAIIVPKDALINTADNHAVYIVENGVAKLKHVKSGYETKGEVEIVSGISPRDKIVVLGQEKLSDGVKVNAVN